MLKQLRRRLFYPVMVALLLLQGCVTVPPAATISKQLEKVAPSPKPETPPTRPYIFSWMFVDSNSMRVRGGTTNGGSIQTSATPVLGWLRLQEATDEQRDRAAILAMAGEYRVSFDFIETVLFAGQKSPARPYRSWATEKVYVLEDSPERISLQHILVMVFLDSTGQSGDPMVMKHWRQDWVYQPKTVLEYQGDRRWQSRSVPETERSGAWSQTVWHVDDSPRYGSVGQWTHTDAFSSWEGNQTFRPLPRREHGVRSDYDVLDGTNRHTVLPLGWTHEQDNLKHVQKTDAGRPLPYISREYGVNRYESIVAFDFSGGDKSMKESEAFWKHVRGEWDHRMSKHDRFRVLPTCEGQPAFISFFDSAGKARNKTDEENRATARRLLDCVFEPLTN